MKKFIILMILIICVFVPNISGTELFSSSDSCIVMEANSQRIIYQKNINKSHLTASICKILTCITAIENGDLDSWCTVTKESTSQIGSSIYLELNDKVKLIDLLYGLMLRSGNDAAYLVGQNCGGLEKFVLLMNETAKKIGMTSSTFANPSGLDEESQNYSTCLDMAKLMRYCSLNELYMKINGTNSYTCTTYNGRQLVFINKHRLIQSEEEFIAGKTGYTEKANRTLVSYAKKGDLSVIIVTFNCANDFNEHKKFANYVFDNYQMKVLMKSQIINADDRIISYTPVLLNDVLYPLKDDESNSFKFVVELFLDTKDLNYVGNLYVYKEEVLIIQDRIYRYY